MGRASREDKAIHNCSAVCTEAEAVPGHASITLPASLPPATGSKPAEDNRNETRDALLPSGPGSRVTAAVDGSWAPLGAHFQSP